MMLRRCRIVIALSLWGLAGLLDAKTLTWCGQSWTIKNGSGLGPGPNNWSDSTNNVWVDSNGYLHLKICKVGSLWYCAEITSENSFTYGEYRFRVASEYDKYCTNVVGGLFTYLDDTNEIDIEFTRAWTGTNNANFATQPADRVGNHLYYYSQFTEGNYSSHRFRWETNSIFFQSYYGHADPPPATNLTIATWTYTGGDIPEDSSEKLHLNMWLFKGRAPTATQYLELVVHDFQFIPSTNSIPTQHVSDVFYDDFNDSGYADQWNANNDPALSVQTNGNLRVKTDNYGDDQSGLVTQNRLNWRGSSGCVFQARINAVDVIKTNSMTRTDVKTLLAAVSDGRFRGTLYFATNSAALLGSYVGVSNQYRLQFLTKMSNAASLGTERFSGTITNIKNHLALGPITVGFLIDSNRFQVFARDASGVDLPMQGGLSNGIGYHYLHSSFTSAWWAVGALNQTNGIAYVYYDETSIYITNALPWPDPPHVNSNVVVIGSGTDTRRNPVNALFEKERLQVLYLAGEINWTGTLAGLELSISQCPLIPLSNYTIRVQHTTLDAMPENWISNGWTIIYQADTLITNTGWFGFAPTNWFNYNGTNNLLVDFTKRNGTWSDSGFVRFSAGTTARAYEQYIDDDSDPLAWEGQSPLRDGNPPLLFSNYPNIRLTFSADADLDTLPDAWEFARVERLSELSPTGDFDGDGFSDGDEYQAGTEPTNRLSALELDDPAATGAGYVIFWQSASNRTYTLERSESLTVSGGFTGLISRPATPPLNVYTDTPAGGGPFIYRVRLE